MSTTGSSSTATSTNVLSRSAIIAVAVSVAAVVAIALLCFILLLRRRRAQRRASLCSIGANNLHDTPKSARSSQIVVTKEISRSVTHLPISQRQSQVRASYGSTHSRALLRTSQGSTWSQASSIRPSQASSIRPSCYSASTKSRGLAPPRPARPSWTAGIPTCALDTNIVASASASRAASPALSFSALAPCISAELPLPPPPSLFTGERGSGQIVTTYRHPTPTVKDAQLDFATRRVAEQVERNLGASDGMAEIGFKRQIYTMYDPAEEIGRERWRTIGREVILDGDAKEIAEWTARCAKKVELKDEEIIVGRAL